MGMAEEFLHRHYLCQSEVMQQSLEDLHFSRTISFIDGEDTTHLAARIQLMVWSGTDWIVSAGNFSFNISRLFSTAGSFSISYSY